MGIFYNRVKELDALEQIDHQSQSSACFTVVMGRRRIGKTELLRHFIKNKISTYLFTSRETETTLCNLWQKKLEKDIGLKIYGSVTTLPELFEQVLIFSEIKHFILVIDEFQDLQSICPSFFSHLQNLWDTYKSNSKINLIVCGSLYSMMTKIFQDAREPLFGRSTHQLTLKAFTPSSIKKILLSHNPHMTPEDLLCLYMLSGGVAKYIFLLMKAGATTKSKMIDYVCQETSPFLTDGKNLLISEMGRDYGTYFSILKLISAGLTTQSEIDSIIQKNTGAYLKNLEQVFEVIRPIKPILSRPESRNTRWEIIDSYLKFYFHFIYPNQYMIELGETEQLKEVILAGYEQYSGKTLEQYFTHKIIEENEISQIGGWWDRKSQNEIDIITLHPNEKTGSIYEVKRQGKKLNLDALREKASVFTKAHPQYQFMLQGLSMEDM